MKTSRVVSQLLALLSMVAMGTAFAEDHHASGLALGDSFVFGYITQAGHEYVNPANFVGYPEHLAGMLEVGIVNASCPGEATTSFLSATGVDNGCRQFRGFPFPLHAAYSGTQVDFAKQFLSHHHDVRFVTISLGANDAFIFERGCNLDPVCIHNGLPAFLGALAANMGMVLADLRGTGFGGKIVIVNYYSLDYSDATQTGLTALLNQAVGAYASAYGAVVADVFTAFGQAAAPAGGKTCSAGLLNVDPANLALCDKHPSQSGSRLVAETVARTLGGSGD